jgi:transposase
VEPNSRLTIAVAEEMNSKIMSIKRRAGGYRNIENIKKQTCFTAVG